MIPEASNIAQAAQIDEQAFREIDLSMRTDVGWATAGRYRTFVENPDEPPNGGFWICHAVENDDSEEWIMNLATCKTPYQLYGAIERLNIQLPHFIDSLTYLI